MSDNEAEHEGNLSGVLAGAKEQPVIAELQLVQPNIRPITNF